MVPYRNLQNRLSFSVFLALKHRPRSTRSLPALRYNGRLPTLDYFVSLWQGAPRDNSGGAPPRSPPSCSITRDAGWSGPPPRPCSPLLPTDEAAGGRCVVSSPQHLSSRRPPLPRDAGAEPSALSRLTQEHSQEPGPPCPPPARPGAHHNCSRTEPLEMPALDQELCGHSVRPLATGGIPSGRLWPCGGKTREQREPRVAERRRGGKKNGAGAQGRKREKPGEEPERGCVVKARLWAHSGAQGASVPVPAGPSLSPSRSCVLSSAFGEVTLGSQHSPCRAPLSRAEKEEEADLGA